MTTQSVAPEARPILAYSRFTGEPVGLVQSATDPNVRHLVTATSCSCKGFQYRRSCRHLAPKVERPLADGGQAHLAVKRAAGEWPKVSPEIAAKAEAYHSIFGRDE